MAQRLVRAKSALRGTGTTLTIPEGPELDERLHSVLDVLYLLFNEGYAAHSGPSVVRHDVAREALRLGNLVVRSAPFAVPKTHALLALMHFQTSRLAARQASDGTPLSLEEQDRGLWDRAHVRSGFAHLERASRGDTLTAYHLEAGIASCHASAPSFAATDWQRILSLYDQLATRAPSPIVDLNRAVALAAVHGPAAALTELDRLRADPLLARYHLLHATCAEMHRRLGDFEAATDELQRALALATSEPDRRLLERRLRERRANDLPPPQS